MERALRLAAAVLLAAAMVGAAGRLRAAREKPYDVEVIPTAAAVRWLTLGHALTGANLYWLRTVQYIGEPRADERGWERLHPLVNLVTDLDPGHGYAYQVAGIVLSSAGRIDESNAILEKGSRNVKDRYILPYLRAFNAFYHQGDWDTAGHWAEIAARTPGAPPHVRQNVLAYYVKGQRAEAALEFLETVRREAQDDETRKALDGQIQQALLERDAGKVDEAVKRYTEMHGRWPPTLLTLVTEGYIDRIPPDPYGGKLVLGKDGRVTSSVHAYRLAPAPTASELTDPNLGPALQHVKPASPP